MRSKKLLLHFEAVELYLRIRKNFVDGYTHGLEEFFNEDGSLMETMHSFNGLEHGLQTANSYDGSIRYKRCWQDGIEVDLSICEQKNITKSYPEQVVENFYSAMACGEINIAKKYATAASSTTLDLIALGGVSEILKPYFKYEHLKTQDAASYFGYAISQEEIVNETGFEDIVIVYFNNGYEIGECTAVKENGEWKVNMNLFTLDM